MAAGGGGAWAGIASGGPGSAATATDKVRTVHMPDVYPEPGLFGALATRDECVPNIGPAGRRRRYAFGAVLFVLGALLAVVLATTDTPRFWRLGLLPLFWGGAIGVMQAYFHT